ncbi:hypothetical protein ACOSP7_020524 [Xanthoceras sorbifolium]
MEGELHASKKVKTSNQVETDRLTYLPDSVIHHILSLMDTIYAVRTCVLSKRWRYQWTYIHSLNFDYGNESFNHKSGEVSFTEFVRKVLRHRKPLIVRKLKLYCRGTRGDELIMGLYPYASAYRFEELDTDVVGGFPPNCFKCQTLKTLKIHSRTLHLADWYGFATLTTLQLDQVIIYDKEDGFSNCLNLESLLLLGCYWSDRILIISAPRLVNLKILCREPSQKFKITSPGLKFFDLKGTYPIHLNMDKCQMLDKVNIHLSPPIDIQQAEDGREMYILKTILMVKAFRSKSLSLSFDFSKKKFILSHNITDAETKVMQLEKETGEKQLLFALPMGHEWDIDRVITIFSDMLEEMRSNMLSEVGPFLIGLGMMAGFHSQLAKDIC